MALKINHIYSRQEISNMLGGSNVAYLPFRDEVVTCGCFRVEEEYNPGAPNEVMFGCDEPMPDVEKAAKMVREQDKPIPIFIRRGSAKWEYIGNYQCVELERDANMLKQKMKEHPRRGQIKGILRFKKV